MPLLRRDALKLFGLSPLALGAGEAPMPAKAQTAAPQWGRTVDNQRKADRGDGTYLNPIMAGDHPDPSILKDGDVYYMTFSSFDAYPGLIIWKSYDLINWSPVTAALTQNVGSVWAPCLCKHKGRFFLYIPTKVTDHPGTKTTSWVIWADHIEGPWSEPLDLNLPNHIDPGHAVGEDGSRWLFLSGGDRVRLSEDGLTTQGAPEHVYDPWRYSEAFAERWPVEGFSPEGPKIMRRGDWFYLLSAIGGTAGPPTGHMVISARSRSVNGPWEQHPRNPLVHTASKDEAWWSRGHATLVEGPAGDWWSVYHGYENDFWTLGRQTLLAPVTWGADGWPEFGGGDLSQPIPAPKGGKAQQHGMALSDDFSTDAYGLKWNFFQPGPDEGRRIRRADNILHLTASGSAPKDSAPLLLIASDPAYEIQCEIEIDPGARAGLILFYDSGLYCGLGFDEKAFITHQYGLERGRPVNPYGRRLFLRLRNDRHIVQFHTSADGGNWTLFDRGMEVSGYHHNVRGGFLMLKPGLYAAGEGEARFRDFRYRAL
jgi:beta-xylosidase